MTNAEKLTATLSKELGEEFEPTWRQTAQLRKAEELDNVDEIIASFPGQLRSLREGAAKPFDTVTWEEIPAAMVSFGVRLDYAAKGFGSNNKYFIIEDFEPDDIFSIGFEEGVQAERERMVRSLFTDGLNRPIRPNGLRYYLGELAKGHSFFKQAVSVYLSDEAKKQRNE